MICTYKEFDTNDIDSTIPFQNLNQRQYTRLRVVRELLELSQAIDNEVYLLSTLMECSSNTLSHGVPWSGQKEYIISIFLRLMPLSGRDASKGKEKRHKYTVDS